MKKEKFINNVQTLQTTIRVLSDERDKLYAEIDALKKKKRPSAVIKSAERTNYQSSILTMEKEIAVLRDSLKHQAATLDRLRWEKAEADKERDDALKAIGRIVIKEMQLFPEQQTLKAEEKKS